MLSEQKTIWFCQKMNETKNSMYLTAMGILRNKEDTEDAMQNALILAYTHLNDLRFFDKFKPWILKILTNECYKILKKRMYTLDIEEDEASLSFVQDRTTEQKTELWESVLALELKYRTVIILYYYESMAVKDIAKVLGTTTDAIKQQLSRARKMLRNILEKEELL